MFRADPLTAAELAHRWLEASFALPIELDSFAAPVGQNFISLVFATASSHQPTVPNGLAGFTAIAPLPSGEGLPSVRTWFVFKHAIPFSFGHDVHVLFQTDR